MAQFRLEHSQMKRINFRSFSVSTNHTNPLFPILGPSTHLKIKMCINVHQPPVFFKHVFFPHHSAIFNLSIHRHLIGMVHQGDLVGPEDSTFHLFQGKAHHSLRGQLCQQRQARPAVAAKRSARQEGLQHLEKTPRGTEKNTSWGQIGCRLLCLFLYQLFVMSVSCFFSVFSSFRFRLD